MKHPTLAIVSAGIVTACLLWSAPVLRSHETVGTTVTFDREISRILKRRCISCHTPGSVAFPLTTYEETRPWARAIEEEVLRRHMPPWRAVPGYGVFANDGGLTGHELQLVVAWIQGNGPKDLAQRTIVNIDQGRTAATDRLRSDVDRWELGHPDLLRTLPPSLVAAGRTDQVREVELDLGISSPRMIGALEFKPGDRRVLRAAFFSIRETGQWIGSWTPWSQTTSLPKDVAHRVPAGAHLVAELHYRGASMPVEDRGTIGIHFARHTTPHCTSDLLLTADGPPRPSPLGPRVEARATLRTEARILAFKPELGPSADSLEVTAHRPDGTSAVLLFVKGILPEWPTPYVLENAVSLPAGTEISMTSYQREAAGDAGSAVRLMMTGGGYGDCDAPRSLTSKVNANVWSVSR